ncbi:MAG: hypothetical protein QGF59_24690 [Pirellulaceae bacterium]|jgi:hypothetical protein|nr:hypothetical protein [Pirellulaceae bacterium]MDP6721889.1 hypothetical protein [Pirellulaceae bacterium]
MLLPSDEWLVPWLSAGLDLAAIRFAADFACGVPLTGGLVEEVFEEEALDV